MLKLNGITKIYNENKPNQCVALKDVDLTVNQGELIAIKGKSGSGKSTLLHILGCIDRHTKGAYLIDSKSTSGIKERELARYRNKKFGIILQEFLLIDSISVLENAMMPLYFTKMSKKDRLSRAHQLIFGVGLKDKLKEPIDELSGGQKQRVAIARALMTEPDIILADEPTGALDTATSQEIMDLLLRINSKGKTIIIITHEESIASQCNRIITLSDGQIISDITK